MRLYNSTMQRGLVASALAAALAVAPLAMGVVRADDPNYAYNEQPPQMTAINGSQGTVSFNMLYCAHLSPDMTPYVHDNTSGANYSGNTWFALNNVCYQQYPDNWHGLTHGHSYKIRYCDEHMDCSPYTTWTE